MAVRMALSTAKKAMVVKNLAVKPKLPLQFPIFYHISDIMSIAYAENSTDISLSRHIVYFFSFSSRNALKVSAISSGITV